MYCNFTKSQAFPLAFRVSSQPRCFNRFHTLKPQYFPVGSHPNPPQNPVLIKFTTRSNGSVHNTLENFCFVKHVSFSNEFHHITLRNNNRANMRNASSGFPIKSVIRNFPLIGARSFSSFGKRNGVVRTGKTLPWLAAKREKDAKRLEKVDSAKTNRSTWNGQVKRLEKTTAMETSGSSWKKSAERLQEANTTLNETNVSSWKKAEEGLHEATTKKTIHPSIEKQVKRLYPKHGTSTVDNPESRTRLVGDRRDGNIGRGGSVKEEEEEEEEAEVINNPRWDQIKDRLKGVANEKEYQKSESRRWDRQENWGRKTWKEATESTVPKMVGEGIYGVGPVLAALSAGRREFYTLYVQEALDLSSNNKKKKDKKGFEKVLRIAEKIGLSMKAISKHDLNMIVDNRPHQGLVLDASPLEMVRIKELDPVSTEEEKGTLWVALDEVTDPQNLGAIIRSSYFFGATGVVLCAKNSAPLSGVVSKASAGSLELMELRYCKNMMQFLASSAENGWRVLGGSVSSRAIPLNEVLPGEPTILVLGSEGTGLRLLVERSCTQLVRIPGNIPVDVAAGGVEDAETVQVERGCSGEEFRSFLAVESLNVSVAAGVLLHHLIGNYYTNFHSGDKQVEALE